MIVEVDFYHPLNLTLTQSTCYTEKVEVTAKNAKSNRTTWAMLIWQTSTISIPTVASSACSIFGIEQGRYNFQLDAKIAKHETTCFWNDFLPWAA
jgi:hypothetical protein